MNNNHILLRNLVYKGASEKSLIACDSVLDRINYELSVIEKLGFTDYFIVYSRIIEVCNELNILRSFGRGNAASSIVNYCLDIAKINPIDENLIFEMFILPNQKNLPDIDIDVPTGYRNNIIKRFKQKYTEYYIYYIAIIPHFESDYKDVFYNDKVYKEHPFGLIVLTEKLNNSTFIYNDIEYYLEQDGNKDPIYDSKIDIVELDYLFKLQLIADEIGNNYHPYQLPFDDKQVFDFFASGNLVHIFHFNAPSLKQVFSQFKPNSIHDLSVINTLSNPASVNFIPRIVSNRILNETDFYDSNAKVSKILSETYGLLLYQETFLQLSKEIAGISFSEAEKWKRKIMRDKTKTEIKAFIAIFKKGCREHNALSETELTNLINLITEMLPLTLPKSHFLSYSIIGYWGAYYKTHFTSLFDKIFNGISNTVKTIKTEKG